MQKRGLVIAMVLVVICSAGYCEKLASQNAGGTVDAEPVSVTSGDVAGGVVKIKHVKPAVPAKKSQLRCWLGVKLDDGSLIYGIPEMTELKCITSYASMKIPFDVIDSVKVADDNEHASITMKNDDTLSVIINLGDMVMDTVFGKVSLPIEHIDQISVQIGKLSMDGLVLNYSFDNDTGSNNSDKAVFNKSRADGVIRIKQGRSDESCFERVRTCIIPTAKAKTKDPVINIFDKVADQKASVVGAKWINDGHSGGAYLFDGKDDYIKLPDAAKQKGPFTVSIWFTQENPSQKSSLYGGGGCDAAIDRNGIAMTWVPANKSFYLDVYDTPTRYNITMTTSEINIVDGKWHHAVGTYDGKYLALYIDGKLSKSGKKEIGKIDIDWSRADHILGNRGEIDYFYKWYWKGKMDELMIFNRALSEHEVKQLYMLN